MSRPVVQNKPTAAFALSLVGGVLELVASFALIIIAAVFSVMKPYSYTSGYTYYSSPDLRGLAWIFGVIAVWLIVASIILIASAAKLNSNPLEHSKWGTIILVFSIVGGINIFGIIGGALALSYRPQLLESNQPNTAQVNVRYCSQCGQTLDPNSRFCIACGKQVNEQ